MANLTKSVTRFLGYILSYILGYTNKNLITNILYYFVTM